MIDKTIEDVARIIDPLAWEIQDSTGADHAKFLGITVERSLQKAKSVIEYLESKNQGTPSQ